MKWIRDLKYRIVGGLLAFVCMMRGKPIVGILGDRDDE